MVFSVDINTIFKHICCLNPKNEVQWCCFIKFTKKTCWLKLALSGALRWQIKILIVSNSLWNQHTFIINRGRSVSWWPSHWVVYSRSDIPIKDVASIILFPSEIARYSACRGWILLDKFVEISNLHSWQPHVPCSQSINKVNTLQV